jgi:subtilisin family serine protease
MQLAIKSNLSVDKIKKCKFYRDFMEYAGQIKKLRWHYFNLPNALFTKEIEYSILNDGDILEYGVDLGGLKPNISEVIPDNANFSNQWGFRNIGQFGGFPGIDARITYAWNIHQGDFELITAIVDDGVDVDHEALAGHAYFDSTETLVIGDDADGNGYPNDFVGWNMVANSFNSYQTGHGTALASIVTTNGNGMSGVTWRSRYMPIHIGNVDQIDIPQINVSYPCDRARIEIEAYDDYYASIPTSRVASAITYAADKGAHIILVAYSRRSTETIACCSVYPIATIMPDVRDAIKYAGRQGCVVVTSAGDWLPEGVFPAATEGIYTYSELCEGGTQIVKTGDRNIYPGAYTRFFDFMINVTAHDNWGYLYYEKFELASGFTYTGYYKGTAYGKTNVDIAAPGKDIVIAQPNNAYGVGGGTSLAAAFVAGAAALIWSRNSYLRNFDIVNLIKGTVTKTTYWVDRVSSGGMLNVESALDAAK